MASGKFWKSSLKDKTKNGTLLGLLMGLFLLFGSQIYGFIESLFPNTSSFGLKISILVVFTIIGYAIDKW